MRQFDMSEQLVSIILRSFNEGWALRETLPAIRAQNYSQWELIVIDSGSTDGSVELINRASPRHFLRIAPTDYNPSRVMNYGMTLARSRTRSLMLRRTMRFSFSEWL